MSKRWKLSFVVCAFYLAAMWVTAFGGYSVDVDNFVFGAMPMTIWLAARWIEVKE